jgi:hypothetical protein
MRLSRRSEPFDSDKFIYELKIDGFRAFTHIEAVKASWSLKSEMEQDSESDSDIAFPLAIDPARHVVGLETQPERAEKRPIITAAQPYTVSRGRSVAGCSSDSSNKPLRKKGILFIDP